MAIARTRRPRLIASGVVTSVREKNKKAENGGGIYAYDITLDQDGGAMIAIDQFVRDDFTPADLPSVGEVLTCWVNVQESRDYGASLTFESVVTENDLDRIHSAAAAK